MDQALLLHRLQFGFTITFHYLFPQLTMGLAPLIVALKTLALTRQNEQYNEAARFWARIFGINFTLGVVTGIPMEFQFGTNWSQFARQTGGVIGQPLVMEGVFSFFLESAFLGLFLFGEQRKGVPQAEIEKTLTAAVSQLQDLKPARSDKWKIWNIMPDGNRFALNTDFLGVGQIITPASVYVYADKDRKVQL